MFPATPRPAVKWRLDAKVAGQTNLHCVPVLSSRSIEQTDGIDARNVVDKGNEIVKDFTW